VVNRSDSPVRSGGRDRHGGELQPPGCGRFSAFASSSARCPVAARRDLAPEEDGDRPGGSGDALRLLLLLLLLPPLALEESGQDLDEDDHGYRLPAGNWPGFPAVSHSFAHPARSGQGSNYPSCRAARDGVESPEPGYRATNLSCLGGNRLRRTDNLAEACPRGATSSQQSPPTTAP
jgi:hypothetical protein